MSFIDSILDRIWFRCRHKKLSRVFTLPDEHAVMRSYKKCLDCGATVPYDLDTMRPMKRWREVDELEQIFELSEGGTPPMQKR
jgi:hypothetical protein